MTQEPNSGENGDRHGTAVEHDDRERDPGPDSWEYQTQIDEWQQMFRDHKPYPAWWA